ncbi:MAG: hypothetical protein JKX73_05210, partial [Flavobacteriales bacterium]|nr:hypothetical protein [Flavobacteriales bacterium]
MKKLLLFCSILLIGTVGFSQNSCDSLPRIEQGDTTVCLGSTISLNVKNYYLDSVLSSFIYIGSFGGSRYFASTVPQRWGVAQTICVAAGGHLATMGSAAENTFVGAYNPGTFYWIGFYQNMASPSYTEPAGGWEWITGEPVIFTGWEGGEPNQNGGQPEDFVYTNFNSAGKWNDAPSILPGFDVQLQYVLEIEDEFSVLWSTGDTTDTITVTPLVTTTYYVTTSDTAKSCYDSVTVTVNGPKANLPDTVLTCLDSIKLVASSGLTSYLWNTAEVDSVIYADTSGTYIVAVTDGAGCVDVDTVEVSVAKANINQSDMAFCAGPTVSLTVDSASGNTFLWSN